MDSEALRRLTEAAQAAVAGTRAMFGSLTEFDRAFQGALAEQRHTYLDMDPDSRFRPTNRSLCDHGFPLGNAGWECSACISHQYGRHTPDWEEVGEERALRFCRRCGLSSGTHTVGLL